jgi:tripartite-type tricarboxylate transporter receptor subunit TctC
VRNCRSAFAIAFASAGVMLLCSSALAQDNYPNRPIRFVTPAAPGGTTDLLARLLGVHMTESFKVQVVVDNRASASGVIAGEITANAPPDGYTIMMAYHQHTVNAAFDQKLPYHPVNSFTPITRVTSAGLLLVVNPSSPPKTPTEFMEWTISYPGPLNFGSAGIGSGGHLAGELYNLMVGIKAQHVPYKGSGPAMIDLAGGHYQYNFAGIQGAMVLVRAGKLRPIAITTPKRVAALPDIPAMAEALPGFEVVGWYGVIAPAHLPQPMVTKLHDEIVRIVQLPEVHERILADGSEPATNSPEEFHQFLLADVAKWTKVVKESGAKAD